MNWAYHGIVEDLALLLNNYLQIVFCVLGFVHCLDQACPPVFSVSGAKEGEVSIMNGLTVNLHLLLV